MRKWFEKLLGEYHHELWLSDAAESKTGKW